MFKFLINLILSLFYIPIILSSEYCQLKEVFIHERKCSPFENRVVNKNFYILYDINYVEGFNLRRDVYIRMAVFVKKLRQSKGFRNAKLVLPPYPHLYHWKSNFKQNQIFWNKFFDLPSLKLYTEVIDFWEFLNEVKHLKNSKGSLVIDDVFKLQHFDSMFDNGVFEDKFEEAACRRSRYSTSNYFEYHNITENRLLCLNFQGSAGLLYKVLKTYVPLKKSEKPRIVMFANAETVLHDYFGDEEYWMARRSMRFSKRLVDIANEYRRGVFGSTDELDFVQRPLHWIDEKPYRGAQGGEYLCVHLRRGDFLYGRETQMPTLRSVSYQIKESLLELGVNKVYLSSDCSGVEFHDFLSFMHGYRVLKYKAKNRNELEQLGDGGIAIIDQIICSHARKFIGTYESTFTYRIYEEREILGFPQELTFHTLCKRDDHEECKQNSIWPIVY